jgi:hypothetical protein
MNVKGAVQRKSKLANALTHTPADEYLFNLNKVESVDLPFLYKTNK